MPKNPGYLSTPDFVPAIKPIAQVDFNALVPASAAASDIVGRLFPSVFVLFRAVVGSVEKRVLVVESSRSLYTVRTLNPHPRGHT